MSQGSEKPASNEDQDRMDSDEQGMLGSNGGSALRWPGDHSWENHSNGWTPSTPEEGLGSTRPALAYYTLFLLVLPKGLLGCAYYGPIHLAFSTGVGWVGSVYHKSMIFGRRSGDKVYN